MNQKQRQIIGSAIGTAILSLAAQYLGAPDKATAAVLTYNFTVDNDGGSGFLKFDNSSLTGIGTEQLAVSEGKFYGFTASSSRYPVQGKDYFDLAGATALFFQGEFRGLRASGSDEATGVGILNELQGTRFDRESGPVEFRFYKSSSWSVDTLDLDRPGIGLWVSQFRGFQILFIGYVNQNGWLTSDERKILNGSNVFYTLIDTAAEPVPEPLTFAGTALALAGLSWLRSQKKRAV